MNAVKRCLALFAATLVVGACSGDPTADEAGANLSIRATPGAVWMRHTADTIGGQASVIIEAIDGLGGPQPGSWTTTTTGPITVALDPDYQTTTSGPLGNARRYIITSSAEGEGSVIFTGSGGTLTIPVRIAPDALTFNSSFSVLTPAVGQVVTVTAPLGIVFTGATTIRWFTGPLATDTSNGRFFFSTPTLTALNADSSQISFIAGPGANGHPLFTGLASRATPTLQSSARDTSIVFSAATVDTSNLPITLSNAAPTVLDTVIATIAAPYRFTSTSVPLTVTPTSGGASPIFAGFSADSFQARFIVPPGASGKVRFPRVVMRQAPSAGYPGRSAATLTASPAPPLSAVFSNAAPAVNAPITITMPAGFKFRPTSLLRDTTTTQRNFIVVSRAADSNSVVVIPVPGYNGKVQITNVQLSAAPGFALTLNTAGSINVGAAPNLGQDDRTLAGFGTFTATLAVNGVTGFYDQMTLGSPDRIPNGQGGGFPNQWIELVITNSGTYTVSLDWLGTTTDLDLFVVNQAGTTRLLTAATLARPETASVVLAAGTYWIAMADFETGGQWIQVTLRRTL